MIRLEVETDNVEHISNYDLTDKLLISQHDTIRDEVAERIVKAEIARRKNNGMWNE